MPNFLTKLKETISPSKKPIQKKALTTQIFQKSLEYSSGSEVQEENPAQLLREKGDRDLDIYDEMLLDDRVSMAINLKKRLALSVHAQIMPASEDEKDIEIAEEVENQLKINSDSKYTHEQGYSFWAVIDNMMDALSYGYKVAEKVWKYEGDKLVLHNIKFKHSKYYNFDYDEYANLKTLLLGKNYGETQYIDKRLIENKFLLCTYPYVKDGNFYGESELMSIYNKWRSKLHIQKQRDIALEKWGSPTPEAMYDADRMASDEIDALKDLLDNFQESTYLMNPAVRNPKTGELEPKIKFAIHESKNGNVGDSFNIALDQLDKQMTRAILFPDKLGFSESPGGSYNQSETQLDILQVVIEYNHQWIETIINNQLIKQIVDFNYTNVESYPEFKFDRISDKIKSEMLEKLIIHRIVDPKEKWIRQHVGIPILDEKEQDEIDKINKENMPMLDPKNETKDQDDEKEDDNNENPQTDMRAAIFKRKGNPFDSKSVKKYMDNQEDEFVVDYSSLIYNAYEHVIRQIEKKNIVENKNTTQALKDKDALRVPKTEIKKYITNKFSQWYFNGKKQSIDETEPRLNKVATFKKEYEKVGMTTINGDFEHSHEYVINESGNGQTTRTNGSAADHVHEIVNFEVAMSGNDMHGHDIETTFKQVNFRQSIEWLDKAFIDRFLGTSDLSKLTKEDIDALKIIRDRGFTITGIEEEKILKEVKMILDAGIRSGLSTSSVISQIKDKAKSTTQGQALTIARTNLSDNYNTGRMNFFTSNDMVKFIEAYQYQAIMDSATTDFCRQHDGQVIKAGDGRVAQINPPNHFNCRSVLVPVLIGDNENKDSFFYDYKATTPAFGTNVTVTQPDIGFGGAGNK